MLIDENELNKNQKCRLRGREAGGRGWGADRGECADLKCKLSLVHGESNDNLHVIANLSLPLDLFAYGCRLMTQQLSWLFLCANRRIYAFGLFIKQIVT